MASTVGEIAIYPEYDHFDDVRGNEVKVEGRRIYENLSKIANINLKK